MKSQITAAIAAIERARSMGCATAGSRAAVEIEQEYGATIARWESAMCDPGDACSQDDEWQAHQEARRSLPRARREIETLRAEIARAKKEGIL